jgi:glycosyltransferase involved in cell wall biosynthesis
MSQTIQISGFTIVRNAVALDYPFRESVLSALPLCDEYIINCGDSTDTTREQCEALARDYPDKIRLIFSTWQRENQTGGFQLKNQTDRALQECRGKWCVYVQADEVLHEGDYDKVLAAMKKADPREDVDGIVFDYLHFYGDYHYRIQGRNWYRREVRAFKNGRGIEAFRDAQGFRRNGRRLKAIASGAHVFHYGYVRSPESLKKKSGEMSQWWGESAPTDPAAFQLRRHVGLSKFQKSHPAVMRARVAEHDYAFHPEKLPRIWDKNEIKNAVTLVWEKIFPYRIGEFRNYDLV